MAIEKGSFKDPDENNLSKSQSLKIRVNGLDLSVYNCLTQNVINQLNIILNLPRLNTKHFNPISQIQAFNGSFNPSTINNLKKMYWKI